MKRTSLPAVVVKQLRFWLSGPDFPLISWIFLRGLALIYFAAFTSMLVQIKGLIGSTGILPVQLWLSMLGRYYGCETYWRFPTIFWLDASDNALWMACVAGMCAALMLLLNRFVRLSLVLCYGLYLSITVAGQDFTSFQWDAFLLEAGFMGLLLTFGSNIMVLLYRFLIARFMFMGGVVKLASGDPTWANLTALNYHYLTQPLPTPLAYYAFFLPEWFQTLCVAGVLFIELVVPVFVFLPRPFRLFAAWSFIVLQSSIIATGNYNFFNVLTVLLCLFLFDDSDLRKHVPKRLIKSISGQASQPGSSGHAMAKIWAAITLIVCALSIWMYHTSRLPPEPFKTVLQTASAFAVVNNYGPFSIMTTERNEIIVEGSNDGRHWQPYLFNYKPVELDYALSWNIPHQPRLDWQMWFAALEPPPGKPWFRLFLLRLQQGSPEVLALLRYNPFAKSPPKLIRALLYRYTFVRPEQRSKNGQLWQREYLGVYWPKN